MRKFIDLLLYCVNLQRWCDIRVGYFHGHLLAYSERPQSDRHFCFSEFLLVYTVFTLLIVTLL